MITADDFLNYAKNMGYIKAMTLDDADEKPKAGFKVRANVGYQNVNSLELLHVISSRTDVKAVITAANVRSFFDFFGAGFKYAPTMYRRVKTSPHWLAAYNVAPQAFNKIDRRTGAVSAPTEDGTICRRCEVVFPLRTLTIDHQRPQNGGSELAVLRVFRGLGLTKAGPRLNGKNRQALATYAAGVGGNAALAPGVSGAANMNTLSDAGAIYYSVFEAMNRGADLQEACMHHYLNLRPLCGPCNSSLSNSNIF